jgi:thymidylate kinase
MIVIFEGPDGAGKSTMIQAVAGQHIMHHRDVPIEIVEESISFWSRGPFPQDSDPWTEYVSPTSSMNIGPDSLVLIDRWHLGELVYGPIFRGQSRLSMEQRVWIEGYMKTLGAVMVHLTASLEELTRRLAERGDDMVTPEHLPAILSLYDRLTADGHQPRIYCRTYDTTNQRVEPTAAAIYQLARTEQAIALAAARHPSADPRPYWERIPWPT